MTVCWLPVSPLLVLSPTITGVQELENPAQQQANLHRRARAECISHVTPLTQAAWCG